jgi:hypothetical protein
VGNDLSLAAYLAGSRAGASLYNVAHSYALPLALVLLDISVTSRLTPLALIWIAHISCDRLIGSGLQYPTGTGETHLGRMGLPRLPTRSA